MKPTFLTINNWFEFLEQPGMKMVYISSPTCDCGIDVFIDWVEDYHGDIPMGIIQGDIDPETGYPSRIFPTIRNGVENINDLILNSPSAMIFDGISILDKFTDLETTGSETGNDAIFQNLTKIINEFEKSKVK